MGYSGGAGPVVMVCSPSPGHPNAALQGLVTAQPGDLLLGKQAATVAHNPLMAKVILCYSTVFYFTCSILQCFIAL